MKRWMILLLVCLLLCGCGAEQLEDTTIPTETEFAVPTEPAGSYDPNSQAEQQTAGAVRVYPLGIEDCCGFACMGKDVVIFSINESTTLTKLSGENLYTTALAQIDIPVYPDDPSTQVSDKGISYYNAATKEVVLLDTTLREVNRIEVPEDIVGTPVLSANRKKLYYCTENSVRVLDLETGISRMLKEITYPVQTVTGLLMGDTVVQCSLSDGETERNARFFSADTGETLWETRDDLTVTTLEDTYYVTRPEGAMQALIYGQPGQSEKVLIPADIMANGWYLEALDAAVTIGIEDNQNTAVLNYYDLESGLRLSVLTLEDCSYIGGVEACEADGPVYVLGYDAAAETETLYRWDVKALPSGDNTVYTGPRYTIDAPDEEGLAQCRTRAQEIGERFGVEILIGTEAVEYQPWDYTLEIEYQVPLIWRDLEKLEEMLGNYPEGMLKAAAETTASGVLKICLVRNLYGSPESGSLDTAEGVQYWIEENAYIALAVGHDLERNLYHELFHVLETKVLSDCTAYYDWEKLNPEGFEYDYDYLANQNREDSLYLEDDTTRVFIDSYSMSFPKEDRARIMEYAMTEGNEHYFQSETMQAKLYQLCLGIREAFGLEASSEVFLWEQYLKEPLTPEGAE